MGAFGCHDDKRVPKGKAIDDGTINSFPNEHGGDHHGFKPFQGPEDIFGNQKVRLSLPVEAT